MAEILHAWALAPAVVGTCCLAARRRRVRVPELAASVLMLIAMLDAARSAPLLQPVWWASLLTIAAIALAAFRRSRATSGRQAARRSVDVSRGSDEHSRAAAVDTRRMSVHTTLGMIAMAALLLAMSAHPGGAGHAHGVTAGAFVALLVGGSALYALGSALVATTTVSRVDRIQYVAMGATTLFMGLALLA